MLKITRASRPSVATIDKFISSSVHQMFVEIPQRGLLQLSKSLPKDFTVHRVTRKHGNAREILQSFCRMNASGAEPTRFSLCSTLNSCAKTLNWHLGLQLHARIIKTGYEDNLVLNSALVDLYAKCDAVFDARRIFDGIKCHDQVSWTSIISGYSQSSNRREAILMFQEMLRSEIKPNCVTYVSAVSACSTLEEAFEQGTSLHAQIIKLGFCANSFVASSLIDCYSKCGRIEHATLLFHAVTERDNIIYNSMISGYSLNLYCEEALDLFMKMRNDNASPTDHTLTSILNACGSLTVLQQGRQVHSLVIKMGSESNVFVVSALIDMYSKCGSVGEARFIFYQTDLKNSVLWTSMIMGYAQSGMAFDALELFERLVTEERYKPDHVCFMAVLTACKYAGLLDRGAEYFKKMMGEYGLVPDFGQYACLIDLYARNGHLSKARELMEEMPYETNSVMWSSFLSSCKVYDEVELGREAANRLFKMEPNDAAPYLTLAHLYAKAGLWDKAAEIRKSMERKGVRKSTGWSWVDVENRVHVFSVGDATHPMSQEIYAELEKLNLEMKNSGYMPKMLRELKDIDHQ